MANISMEHVSTENDLPEQLVTGRLYFIEDTGIIRVNHGFKVVDYGGKTDIQLLTAIYAQLDALYSLQTEMLAVLQDSDFTGYVDDDEDIEQMLDDVFADSETDEDITQDSVTDMFDDVFNGNETLNDGDVDDDFIDLLDEVFGD